MDDCSWNRFSICVENERKMSGGQRSFCVRDGFDFICVCSHFIMAILPISATEAPRKSLLHHIKLRTPLISSATAFTQSFYASASPDQILATSSSLCNVTVSNLLHFFSILKLLFISKRRRLSLLFFSTFLSSCSSRVVFLFLFARNCDALPHTRTHEPSLPTRNLPADNLESGRISIMPPSPSTMRHSPVTRRISKEGGQKKLKGLINTFVLIYFRAI